VLTKRKAAGGKIRVRFSLPPDIEADEVALCGDFTDWTPSIEMKRSKTGEWQASVPLEPGRGYRFRYLLDGARWENDWAADSYAPNPFGGEDSIVEL
jgi:1,4-alpha-glucan branching enzyme